MNPWDLLGWFLVTIVGVFVLVRLSLFAMVVGGAVHKAIRHYRLYWTTRNVEPEKGQRWYGKDGWQAYEITNVWTREQLAEEWSKRAWMTNAKLPETKRVGVRHGTLSFGEDVERWRVRVKNRKLYLGGKR